MKKLLLLSAASLIIAVTVNAQTEKSILKKEAKSETREKRETKEELRRLGGTETSYQAKQEFISDFGNTTVTKWERTDNYDKATFTKDGKEFTAYYDADAKLVGTTSYRTFGDIPMSAQKQINKEYKDYVKGDVLFYDDNEANETDMTLYGLQFADTDSYFVELQKGNQKIILQVLMDGQMFFFKQLK